MISREKYKDILEKIPICCVDLLIHEGKKILLIKRNEEPEKNKWALIGGRIHKKESLIGAVKRKAIEEIGCEIDIEHYFYYVHKKNDWGLKNSYNWFVEHGKKLKRLDLKERKKIYTGFYFLHGIEVLFILFLLGDFLHPYFLFVLFGFAFHLMLDIFHNFFYGHTRLDKFSIIYDYFKYKKLKFIEEVEGS